MTLRFVPAGDAHADALDALFARAGRADFARQRREAWPASGARSLIAEDDAGNVVMHVAVFPCRIGDGRREWRGGLLGDLLADEQHRNFFGPVQLLRRAVADARADGIELLYSDPTPPARGVLKAAGFQELGTMRRHIMPAALPWRLYSRLRSGRPPVVGGVVPASDSAAQERQAVFVGGPVRVRRAPSAGISRAGAFDRWLLMQGSGGDIVAQALVSTPAGERRAVVMDLAWQAGRTSSASVLLAAARWSAAQGLRRLDIHVLDGSVESQRLRRAGFLARADEQPIVIQQLAGAEPPPVSEWFLSRIDGSAWWPS